MAVELVGFCLFGLVLDDLGDCWSEVVELEAFFMADGVPLSVMEFVSEFLLCWLN